MNAARFPNGLEVRAAVELRATSGRKLEGYAATFGTVAQIGSIRESIRAGAFQKSLAAGGDILFLADHDPMKVLARTAAGNLRLGEDSKGLHFEANLPDTSSARDAWAMVDSRTAGGMSFGFRPITDRWPTRDQRELIEVTLIECSLVSAFPAYGNTSVAARSAAQMAEPAHRLRRIAQAL